MNSWKDILKKDPVPLLQQSTDPSIRYYILTKLSDVSVDDGMSGKERNSIVTSDMVRKLLGLQHEDGYWGNPADFQKRFTGTLWQLLFLLEAGCDPLLPQMQKAARCLLDIDFDTRQGFLVSWKRTPQDPCYQGYILQAVLCCGFENDPRVKAIIGWICSNVEFHDGDGQVKDPDDRCLGRHTCIRAAVPLVRALSMIPLQQRNPDVERLLREGNEFLLVHHVYRRSHNLSKVISPYMTRLSFPAWYYPDILQILVLLTDQGVFDDRMEDAVKQLLKKQDGNGMWKLQRPYNERKPGDTFPVLIETGEKGHLNEWITVRALYVLKKWYEHANAL
jgi:hypothetical protein